MKITMDRLQQIIQEEVDVYLLREKLKNKKEEDELKKLKGKKNLSPKEQRQKKKLVHQ